LQTSGVPKSAFSRKSRQLRGLLISAREAAGLTQVALAKKLGRPQSFVSKFETGERRLDVIEFLEIAQVLRVDPIRLIRQLEQ
jgi:transcriptional regulator with XRE-family HTH domain